MTSSIAAGQEDLTFVPLIRSSVFAQLWRRRGTFVVVLALVLAAEAAALLIVPVRYQSSGAVIVTGPEPLAGSAAVPASVSWQEKLGDPADLESNLLLIVSPRLLRQIVSSATATTAIQTECETVRQERAVRLLTRIVAPQHGCAEIAASNDLKLEWVRDRYGAGSLGRSRVISVGYTSPLPDIAQQMANLLITAYLDDGERNAKSHARRASRGCGRKPRALATPCTRTRRPSRRSVAPTGCFAGRSHPSAPSD